MTGTTKTAERGRFITFEGIDGAGKSTHIAGMAELLQKEGKDVIVTREPGGTRLGEALRTLLLHERMHVETEALLMFAARQEHLSELIEPALARGTWVISDRFSDASFAYQGGGRGLTIDKLKALEQWVHPHLQPDLTFLFDLDPDIASARLDGARDPDKFESEANAFFHRVRDAYLRRAEAYPHRFRIIDSSRSIDQIAAELAAYLRELI